MSKKIFLALFAAVFAVPSFVQADLVRYDFTGTVSSIVYSRYEIFYNDVGDIINFTEQKQTSAVFGISRGAAVNYSFLVDTDRLGYFTDADGVTTPQQSGQYTFTYKDTTKEATFNSYYSEFTGTELLPNLTPDDNSDLRIGTDEAFTKTFTGGSVQGTLTSLSGGQNYHNAQVSNAAASINEWTIGTLVQGMEYSTAITSLDKQKNIEIAMVTSSMRLAAIEPVPEPGVTALLVCGVLSVALLTLSPHRCKRNDDYLSYPLRQVP